MHWIFLYNQGKLIFSCHHVPAPARQSRGKGGLCLLYTPNHDFHLSPTPWKPSMAPQLRQKRWGAAALTFVTPGCVVRASHRIAKKQSYGWRIHFKWHSPFLESKCEILSAEGNLIALHLYRWLIKQICLSSSKWLLKSRYYTNTWSSLLPQNVGQLRYFIACPSLLNSSIVTKL